MCDCISVLEKNTVFEKCNLSKPATPREDLTKHTFTCKNEICRNLYTASAPSLSADFQRKSVSEQSFKSFDKKPCGCPSVATEPVPCPCNIPKKPCGCPAISGPPPCGLDEDKEPCGCPKFTSGPPPCAVCGCRSFDDIPPCSSDHDKVCGCPSFDQGPPPCASDISIKSCGCPPFDDGPPPCASTVSLSCGCPSFYCGSPPCSDDETERATNLEFTLAIIKPDAVKYRLEIESAIRESGLVIAKSRYVQLTPEQASDFYNDNYGKLCFPHLVAYMSSGPIVVLVLFKRNGIKEWRTLMGPVKVAEAKEKFPMSLRALYGQIGEEFKNAFHGSINLEAAEREIHFFFPDFITNEIPTPDKAIEYFMKVLNKTLTEGLVMCCKFKPIDPVTWLANWLLENNPYKPRYILPN